MTLAIISDSHIPTREAAIPDAFRTRIADADHVIHAGDFETREILDEIRGLPTELTAVYGNADPADIGVPAVADVTIDGVTFVVTHGTINLVEAGVYPTDGVVMSDDQWRAAIADVARARSRQWSGTDVVGVGGHNHQVHDETHEGVRVLNPGTVTGAPPAEPATMTAVTVEDGDVDVTVHEA
ncbi:MAG: metallophosphoesterase family protein [Halobacteriaceae archaeon]